MYVVVWRAQERDSDAFAKARKKAIARDDVWRPTIKRNELFDELLTEAGLLYGTTRRDPNGDLVPLLQPLDLPAAEWVQMMVSHCDCYIDFVEQNPSTVPREETGDLGEWSASLVYGLKRTFCAPELQASGPGAGVNSVYVSQRRSLSGNEAAMLADAGDKWLAEHAPNMSMDLASDLVAADELVYGKASDSPALEAAVAAVRTSGYASDACSQLSSLMMQVRSAEEEAAAERIRGRTELMISCVNFTMNDLAIDDIARLLDNGADVNATDKDGRTALMFARAFPEVSKLLLDRGASVNASDVHGRTALMYATRAGYLQTATVLLDAKADTSAVDKNGATATRHAGRRGYALLFEELQMKRSAAAPADCVWPPVSERALHVSFEPFEEQDQEFWIWDLPFPRRRR